MTTSASSTSPASPVVIIGGGVVGCAIAFELADRHRVPVTVLEKAVPGAEASSAAAGMLGAQAESHRSPSDGGALFHFMVSSRERHAELDARLRETVGFGSGFRRNGAMRVVMEGSDFDAAERAHAWQRTLGAKLSRLDAKETRALEPALQGAIAGALHMPDEAQLDPPLLLRALQQACALRGVTFRTGLVAKGVAERGGRAIGVETSDGVIESERIVVAAGSWSSQLGGLPATLRAVRPVRGQIVQVETRPPIVRANVMGEGGYVVARADGRTLLGSTMEEAGHQKEVTVGGVLAVLTAALRMIPALLSAPITATWAGFRPATREDRPMIGTVPELRGAFVATGHHRNGVLLAAETARAIADLVVEGHTSVDLNPFAPAGFAGPASMTS